MRLWMLLLQKYIIIVLTSIAIQNQSYKDNSYVAYKSR